MNPVKIVDIQDTEVRTYQTLEQVQNTEWFDASTKEPGQPGVFEVNAVGEFDNDDNVCRRFSYFNGKVFGPIAPSPEDAFESRFEKSSLGHTITHFAGLVEAA